MFIFFIFICSPPVLGLIHNLIHACICVFFKNSYIFAIASLWSFFFHILNIVHNIPKWKTWNLALLCSYSLSQMCTFPEVNQSYLSSCKHSFAVAVLLCSSRCFYRPSHLCALYSFLLFFPISSPKMRCCVRKRSVYIPYRQLLSGY